VKANLPKGGTTALLRYKKDVPSKLLCRELQSKTGVALLPGETMEMEGTVRLGFCAQKEVLETGLLKFSKFLRTI
jgi:aspartate/methionine/tyrosine aminotransferase